MTRFDAVIFDMDGTLIDSSLDFQAIRAELGIDSRMGVLETIAQMPEPDRTVAVDKLMSHELSAAESAELMPGALEALAAVGRAGLKTALLTRNSGKAVDIILDRFPQLRFNLTRSREDGPIKPEPDGILRACRDLGITPGRAACVGDFHYDVTAANAAGAVSILLAPGGRPDFADQADFVIESLSELPEILGI